MLKISGLALSAFLLTKKQIMSKRVELAICQVRMIFHIPAGIKFRARIAQLLGTKEYKVNQGVQFALTHIFIVFEVPG
ncbi:hypothetical protein C7H85_04325 [Zobellella endophytica]|uniref:Uncharacterized protein n=1 Tax=Zobellella endophytica TaxID=2116700 RepID=A0A2P7RCY0_9GAMM|nr:hypothetical protein C7H85_04325 [Zobellella endophytica]